jgi:heme-degrading monooxygenase HmoA
VTDLPLTRFRDTFRFVRQANRVADQMRKTPGVVRFSLRANPFRKRYLTFSIWQEPDAFIRVDDFMHSGEHKNAMAMMASLNVRGEKTIRWTSPTADLDWNEAFRRLETDLNRQAKRA